MGILTHKIHLLPTVFVDTVAFSSQGIQRQRQQVGGLWEADHHVDFPLLQQL